MSESSSAVSMLKEIRAAREARWIALGAWGRFKFRIVDKWTMARYRVMAAWAILRYGDDDEYYERPHP